MIKIGDKVKFSKYIPKNFITNCAMRKSLEGNRVYTRSYLIDRKENQVNYNMYLINGDEREGIYVGHFHKKITRKYRLTPKEVEPEDIFAPTIRVRNLISTIRSDSRRMITITDRSRYSTNPRRLDNPRQLDKFAMINYRGKLLGVPITNIFKCNYNSVFKTI